MGNVQHSLNRENKKSYNKILRFFESMLDENGSWHFLACELIPSLSMFPKTISTIISQYTSSLVCLETGMDLVFGASMRFELEPDFDFFVHWRNNFMTLSSAHCARRYQLSSNELKQFFKGQQLDFLEEFISLDEQALCELEKQMRKKMLQCH
jgi:hypothetical protein